MTFQGFDEKFFRNQISPRDQRDSVLCKNQSGEVIPPRSVVQFDGSFTGAARDVSKPDADGLDSNLIAFSGDQTVPIDGEFIAVNSYESLGTLKTGDSPAVGDDIGTEEDAWTLTTSQAGLKARGASGGYAYVVPFSGGGNRVLIDSFSVNVSASGSGSPATVKTGWLTFTDENPFALYTLAMIGNFGYASAVSGVSSLNQAVYLILGNDGTDTELWTSGKLGGNTRGAGFGVSANVRTEVEDSDISHATLLPGVLAEDVTAMKLEFICDEESGTMGIWDAYIGGADAGVSPPINVYAI